MNLSQLQYVLPFRGGARRAEGSLRGAAHFDSFIGGARRAEGLLCGAAHFDSFIGRCPKGGGVIMWGCSF